MQDISTNKRRMIQNSFFLYVLLFLLMNLLAGGVVIAQEPNTNEEAQQLATQTGIDIQLVLEMLAAGIPAKYINQEMVEKFETEIRPEISAHISVTSQITSYINLLSSSYDTLPASVQGVKLRSCSSQNFPFVFLTVGVDDNGTPVTNLTKDNFQCLENGTPQTNFFQVTPPQSGGNVRLADIVFLIDASDSMANEIADVRTNVTAFANTLATSGIDFRLGLVKFGNSFGSNPFIYDSGNLTTDINLFKSFISAVRVGGGFEPGFLALRTAVQGFNFRPGAQRVFILITDEDSDDQEKQATIDLLSANNITVHTAVLCPMDNSEADYCNATSIRGVTGGLLFNVVGPYNQILNTIAGSTADTYILRYQSSNPAFDATPRNVACKVTTPTIQASVACSYTPGAAPQIVLTQATVALNQTPIAEGSSPVISVIVTDQVAPFVQTVTLYYRTTGATEYKSVVMTNIGSNSYQATILPVSRPGVDYYITATDGQVLSALPSTDPGQFPFQIGVLPNVAPQITHTPIANVEQQTNVTISADVVDTTNRIARVELKWRRVGELVYSTIAMNNAGGNRFEGPISGNEVTTNLEYYIRAIDDLGVASLSGTADTPYLITVTPAESPLIFIPGIAGSRLREKDALFDLWVSFLEPDDRVQELVKFLSSGVPLAGTAWEVVFSEMQNRAKTLAIDNDLIAPDVLRKAFGLIDIYDGLLVTLGNEYSEITCHKNQIHNSQKPKLFVFPYDWRRSNVDSAELLKKYVDCIHELYPGVKINILAHSMGGLVARRYIINNLTNHRIGKLITVGTPWLGAPKFIKVLETGDFDWKTNFALLKSERLKELVETFVGAHQLLPSIRYFELGETPFEEAGWDINDNGIDNETYSHVALRNLLDTQRHPLHRPATESYSFHNKPGQDIWLGDQSGIEYHYIVGVKNAIDTIESVIAAKRCVLSNWVCTPLTYFKYIYTRGDKTVPLVSARRAMPNSAPDGANIQIHEVRPSLEQDDQAEHSNLVLSKDVQDCVLQILQNQQCPDTIRPSSSASRNAFQSGLEESIQENNSYYISVIGINLGLITDNNGNITGMHPAGVLIDNASNASYFSTGGQAFEAVVAAAQPYTVTFRSGSTPFMVEVLEGIPENTISAVRYKDVMIPANVVVHLVLRPQGNVTLRYDTDNNGIPETEIPGLIAGTATQDTEPPQITVNKLLSDQRLLVTISAQDSGVGIADVFFSTDGTNFASYTEPISVNVGQNVIYVFADDKVSNRSGLFAFTLLNRIHLPIVHAVTSPPVTNPQNNPPNAPTNPSPGSGATIVSANLILGWQGGDPDGDAVAYDVYIEANDDTPDELISSAQLGTFYQANGLTRSTRYFWRVVARDHRGTVTAGPVWNFITSEAISTSTPTVIPTSTSTNIPVSTPTSTPTPINTSTPTPTSTFTPIPPNTSTSTPTYTSTPTSTPTYTPTPTPTPTFTPVASAKLLSSTLIGDCEWQVDMKLSGFSPNSQVTVSSSYTELVCATGETRTDSWSGAYHSAVDVNGDLTISYLHGGTGSYTYSFIDQAGKYATLSFNTSPELAFVSERDGNEEIYTMLIDGTGLARLTNNSFGEGNPTWSPEGSKIVFHSNRSGRSQIYTMDANGANQIRLLQSQATDEWPYWSPDGSKIAFGRVATFDNDGDRTEVFVVNSDGSNPTRLTFTTGQTGGFRHGCWPSGWTPDSSEILYYCYIDGNDSIWIMNANGTNQRKIGNDSNWNAIPSMAPNGLIISYSTFRDGNYEVYTANRDGSNPVRLTNVTAEDWRPNWSDDSRRIIFESKRDGSTQVYIMNKDGSIQKRLSDGNAYNGQPMWRPASK